MIWVWRNQVAHRVWGAVVWIQIPILRPQSLKFDKLGMSIMPTINKEHLKKANELIERDYEAFVDRVENGLRHSIHGTPFLFPDTRDMLSVACYVTAHADSISNSLNFKKALVSATKRIYGWEKSLTKLPQSVKLTLQWKVYWVVV